MAMVSTEVLNDAMKASSVKSEAKPYVTILTSPHSPQEYHKPAADKILRKEDIIGPVTAILFVKGLCNSSQIDSVVDPTPDLQECWISRGAWVERFPLLQTTECVPNEKNGNRHRRQRYLAFGRGQESGTVHGIYRSVGTDPDSFETLRENESELFAFYGERKLALAFRTNDDSLAPILFEPRGKDDSEQYLKVSDWIFDVRIICLRPRLKESEPKELNNKLESGKRCEGFCVGKILAALGLAHNSVEIWSFIPSQKKDPKMTSVMVCATRLKKVVCEVRCLTYCLTFYGWKDGIRLPVYENDRASKREISQDQHCDLTLSVAVGTVTNQILIWNVLKSDEYDFINEKEKSCSNNSFPLLNVKPVAHTLKGHKGVIFSCNFGGNSGEYLASTSDDRTVRLWKRSDLPIDDVDGYRQPSISHNCSTKNHVTETSLNSKRITNPTKYDYQLLWTGFSHTSRVWDCKFVPTCLRYNHHIDNLDKKEYLIEALISTGEDGTAQIWNIETGEVVSILKGHQGQNIWKVCVGDVNAFSGGKDNNEINHNRISIAMTAGNDGTAKVWNLNEQLINNAVNQKKPNLNIEKSKSLNSSNNGMRIFHLPEEKINPLDECSKEIIKDEIPVLSATSVPTYVDNLSPKESQIPHVTSSKDDHNANEQYCNIKNVEERETFTSNKKNDNKTSCQKEKKGYGQSIRAMCFYTCTNDSSNNRMLVATRTGMLLTFSMQSHVWTQHGKWSGDIPTTHKCETLKNIEARCATCITVHPSGNVVAVGTTMGEVVLCIFRDNNEDSEHYINHSLHTLALSVPHYLGIKGLQWLDNQTLLAFHVKGIIICWTISETWINKLDPSLPTSKLSYTSKHQVFSMYNPEFRIGIPISFAYNHVRNLLFVGDSRGHIAVFDFIATVSTNECLEQSPCCFLPYAHKKEHVNSIIIINNGKTLLSGGNDGCINEYSINSKTPFTLRKAMSLPVPNLSGINYLWQIPQNVGLDRVFAGGYYGNKFVLCDITLGYQLICVDTGGRQRLHDFSTCFPRRVGKVIGNTYDLAVRNSKKDGPSELLIHSSILSSVRSEEYGRALPLQYSLGNPCHGDTILDIAWCEINALGSSLLLSGSNDCTVKMSLYRNGSISFLKQLPTHESCIRAVSSSKHNGTTSSLLIVSGGKLDMSFYRLDEIIDTTDLCSDLSFHFLCRNHLHYSPSIDHRINAVKGLPLLQCDTGTCSELAHLVLSGDSNGDLHITIITESLDQCERISSHVLYNNIRPILSIDMVRISKDHIIAVVGDSAGKVTIWILPGQNFRSCLNEEESNQLFSEHFPSKPACTYIAHTMGTNSVSIIVIEDFKKDNDHATSVLICSGGDDQALTIATMRIDLLITKHVTVHNVGEIEFMIVAKEASSSALKGIKTVVDDEGNCRLYAVGYDQRLSVWTIDTLAMTQKKSTSLKFISSAPIDIFDVNCLDVCKIKFKNNDCREIIAIGGEGVELISMNPNFFRAAKALHLSNYLLLTCGAGFSADSGLATYEQMAETYQTFCNPLKLIEDEDRFQSFWREFALTYLTTKPHEGYHVIERFCLKKEIELKQSNHISPWYIYSSNVDGLFQQFDCFKNSLCEIHGCATNMCCSNGMGYDNGLERKGKIWKDWNDRVSKSLVEDDCSTSVTIKSKDSFQKNCKNCLLPLRPNVLMFNDTDQNVLQNIEAQRERYQNWEEVVEEEVERNDCKLVILELGAGLNVPAVREESEEVLTDCCRRTSGNVTLIRVNPQDAGSSNNEVLTNLIPIFEKAEHALLVIEQWLDIIKN